MLLLPAIAVAHNLSDSNASYVAQLNGSAIAPFLYLGAKHMFTGYDHLLFLFGVIFFPYGAKDILLYVTLFTIGHSLTLVLSVWSDWHESKPSKKTTSDALKRCAICVSDVSLS